MAVACQVSHEDPDEYKRSLRPALRALLERDKDPLGGVTEWVICYVRPTGADPASKSARKVMLLRTHHPAVKRDVVLSIQSSAC